MKSQDLRKAAISFIIVFALFFNSILVSASNLSTKDMTLEFAYLIESIKEYYYYDTELDTQRLMDAAFKGIFEELDEYSEYFNKDEFKKFNNTLDGDIVGIGISIAVNEDNKIVILELLGGTPAEKSGLLPGDIITKIDNVSVSGENFSALVSGQIGTNFTITVLRGTMEHNFNITRDSIHISAVDLYYADGILDGVSNSKTAIIVISIFDNSVSEEFEQAVKKCKSDGIEKIIIDLRDNPGGSLQEVIKIAEMIVPAGPILEIVNKGGGNYVYFSKLKTLPFKKMSVIVNRYSASASELLTAALKDSKAAVIVGETTFGKGVIQQVIELQRSTGAKLTISEYLTRNGNKVQGVGITPDVYVSTPDFLNTEGDISNKSNPEIIKNLRDVLIYIGYDIDKNLTIYDDKLTQSVKNIQKNSSPQLNETGICDKNTQVQINSLLLSKYREKDVALEAAYKAIN